MACRLTPASVNKKFKRSNKFKEDTEIPVQHRATLSDYKGSGYDRGHMAASATVDSSYNAMMESFLLSNLEIFDDLKDVLAISIYVIVKIDIDVP